MDTRLDEIRKRVADYEQAEKTNTNTDPYKHGSYFRSAESRRLSAWAPEDIPWLLERIATHEADNAKQAARIEGTEEHSRWVTIELRKAKTAFDEEKQRAETAEAELARVRRDGRQQVDRLVARVEKLKEDLALETKCIRKWEQHWSESHSELTRLQKACEAVWAAWKVMGEEARHELSEYGIGQAVANLGAALGDSAEESLRGACHELSQRIEELEMLLDAAEAEAKEYRDATTWNTTCLNCSSTLTKCYKETCAKETVQAERDELRKVCEAVANAEDAVVNSRGHDYAVKLTALFKAVDTMCAALGDSGEESGE